MEITLKTLNAEQKKAVTHAEGPLLIVAGAGTGKTTVIAQRLAWLIEQEKAKTDEILALTFTDKAAGEMEERADKLLPYGYVDLWIATFHAFAEKILQLHGLEIGLPNDFKLLNQTEQWLLVRQNLDKFKLDYYRPLGNPTKFIHALVKLFSRAKDEAISPEEYLKYAQDLKLNADGADFIKQIVDAESLKNLSKKERKELVAQEIIKTQEAADAYHVYQQLLLANNALDFGDLITYCLTLFKKRPVLLSKYRAKFKYLLIDEFQDTNHAQYELIRLLAEPKNNITVVGDDDQSIYKFRGASVSNILEFKKDYPKAAEVFLTKNYRSSQNILDLSYKFIQQNNPDRLEVKLAKGKTKKFSKRLEAVTVDRGVIEHLHYQTVDDEVRGVLEKIVALKEQDKVSGWDDFAILARTNEAANLFATSLNQTQIPARFVASRGLYTKPVVLDILAYLRLLDNYHENSAVHRILSSPLVGFSATELVRFNYWAKRKGYSLFQSLQQLDTLRQSDSETRDKLNKFFSDVKRYSQLAQEKSVAEVVLTFLQDSGYLDLLTKEENLASLQSTSYLNQFYQKIMAFERSASEPTVKNFLTLIELEMEAGETGDLTQDLDEGPEAVKVMTVHAAKGLEFKYVFVVNLVDRRFPIDDRPDPIILPDKLIKEILPEGEVHLQEERRLFYVAMTRAKRGLFFTSAVDYGGQRKKKLSRFLIELAEFGLNLSTQQKPQAIAGLKLVAPAGLGLQRPIETEDLAALIPKRFSFTQLKSFANCPYHYWLEYILKIPQPGKAVFSFGTTMHTTLQRFFQLVQQRGSVTQTDLFGATKSSTAKKSKNAPVSLDELLAIYQRSWIDDWYASRQAHDAYLARGRQALQDFYKNYLQELPVPKYLEQMFAVALDQSGEYIISGKIDRIDPLNGGLEIIDYKTGQGKSKLGPDDKEQLLIYKLAGEKHWRQKVERLTYYYLETGQQLSFLGQEKEITALKIKLMSLIDRIRNTKYPLSPEDCTCRNKDLRNL